MFKNTFILAASDGATHLTESEAFDALFLIFLIVFGGWGLWFYVRHRRRKELLSAPFPENWKRILRDNVRLYNGLSDDLKTQLHGLINVFLGEKTFEGCGGLKITEEIKVTIAAQACLLLLNRPTNIYPKLTFILVYPSAYVTEAYQRVGGQLVKAPSARLGESWTRGSLVLAWDHIDKTAYTPHDGHNVVLHEFAHQLDQEDGTSDGTPMMPQKAYSVWSKILAREYDLLQYEVNHRIRDVIDSYGATNPAEFFAVATEAFYEKPKSLKQKHPELYEMLKNYYKIDPLALTS